MMRYCRHPEVIWDTVDDAVVLCHTQTGVFFRTNEVGSIIWDACSSHTVDEIAAVLEASFPDVTQEDLVSDVKEFLTHLQEQGLIQVRS